MSHMKDKDIAMLTAFRTDPKFGLSKKQNRERNKNLENKLSSMGYRGFTKIVGYYNETPEDKDSVVEAEESYIVLNTGSSYADFTTDMVSLSKDFNQQSIVVWNHENQKAYLLDNQGNALQTFNDFSIDTISKGWSDIKGHNLTFIEESANIRFGFTDRFNDGGNWMTAMGYEAAKNKYRKERKNKMNEDLIKELENIPESDEVSTEVPVTMAAAKEDDKKNVEAIRKSFKDLDKLTADFLKQNDNRENKIKVTDDMKKMELMESLFEDYDYDREELERLKLERIKDEVLEILEDEGYNVYSDIVQGYAWDAAEYIFEVREEEGIDYSVDEWFDDTSSNYPDTLEELPMLEKLEEAKENKPGMIGNVLKKYSDDLAKLTNAQEAIDFLNKHEEEIQDKKYLEEVKRNLAKKKGIAALTYLYNILLKGEDMGRDKEESLQEDYSDSEFEEVKEEVLEILEDEGYDVSKRRTQNYASDAADYICMTRGYGEDYSVDEWWEDTQNFPEDLRRLPKVKHLEEGKKEDKLKKEFESRDLWQEVYDAVTKNLSTNETSAKKFSKVRKHQADYSDIRVDKDSNIIVPYRTEEDRKYLEGVADDYVIEIKEDRPLKDSQGEDVKTVKIFAGELV